MLEVENTGRHGRRPPEVAETSFKPKKLMSLTSRDRSMVTTKREREGEGCLPFAVVVRIA